MPTDAYGTTPMSNPDVNEEGCKCQDCGKRYKIDAVVTDDLWEQIKPMRAPRGGGLLCPQCIFTRLEPILGFGSFDLVRCTERDRLKAEGLREGAIHLRANFGPDPVILVAADALDARANALSPQAKETK